jgi:hypothetical protein
MVTQGCNPSPQEVRQDDLKFEACLDYIARPCLKITKLINFKKRNWVTHILLKQYSHLGKTLTVSLNIKHATDISSAIILWHLYQRNRASLLYIKPIYVCSW